MKAFWAITLLTLSQLKFVLTAAATGQATTQPTTSTDASSTPSNGQVNTTASASTSAQAAAGGPQSTAEGPQSTRGVLQIAGNFEDVQPAANIDEEEFEKFLKDVDWQNAISTLGNRFRVLMRAVNNQNFSDKLNNLAMIYEKNVRTILETEDKDRAEGKTPKVELPTRPDEEQIEKHYAFVRTGLSIVTNIKSWNLIRKEQFSESLKQLGDELNKFFEALYGTTYKDKLLKADQADKEERERAKKEAEAKQAKQQINKAANAGNTEGQSSQAATAAKAEDQPSDDDPQKFENILLGLRFAMPSLAKDIDMLYEFLMHKGNEPQKTKAQLQAWLAKHNSKIELDDNVDIGKLEAAVKALKDDIHLRPLGEVFQVFNFLDKDIKKTIEECKKINSATFGSIAFLLATVSAFTML